jgi:hypothetical protein
MLNLVGGDVFAGHYQTIPNKNALISADRRRSLQKVGFYVNLGLLTKIISKENMKFFCSDIELW